MTDEGEKFFVCFKSMYSLCGPLDVDFISFCWRKASDEQSHIDFGVNYPSTAVYVCKQTYCERMKDLTLFLVISSEAKRTMQEDQSRLKQRTVLSGHYVTSRMSNTEMIPEADRWPWRQKSCSCCQQRSLYVMCNATLIESTYKKL